jgi:hypothetical protein
MQRFLLTVLAVVTATAINSCSTTQIGKLEGKWQLFFIDRLDDENIYIWEFAEGSVFTITQFTPPSPVNPNPTPSVICRGEYDSKAQFIDATVQITNLVSASGSAFQQLNMFEFQTYEGDWKILKVDNEVMRLGSDYNQNGGGGYVIREFTRAD